jgi:hypothetical protein
MTMTDDDEINAMVRAAAAYPVDESRLAQAVLTRIRDDEAGLFGLFNHGLRRVPLAFALVLAATPVIVTQLPDTVDDEAVAALMLGDGMLGMSPLDDLLTGEELE